MKLARKAAGTWLTSSPEASRYRAMAARNLAGSTAHDTRSPRDKIFELVPR